MPRLATHRPIRLVLLAVFALLVTGPPAQAAFPGRNGKITFVSERAAYEVFTMNADGSGITKLTDVPGFARHPAWSPDGTEIAFVQAGGDSGIYKMNADGSNLTRLSNGPVDEWPAWSPDGTKIAFASNRDDPVFDIYTMNTAGSGVTRLTSDGFNRSPAWSPDGSKIAFQSVVDPVSCASEFGTCNYEISTMNTDGSGVTDITDDPATDDNPNWSPDGSKIAFERRGTGVNGIYTMNSDGSGVVKVSQSGDVDQDPAWSPDGSKIAFASIRGGPGGWEIFTMNRDGSGVTNLTNYAALDEHPDWQPLPYTGYARPKGATPFRASLVVAFKSCTAPNRQHGPALAFPSCAPPVQESDWLTTGTADSNGQATEFVGSVRFVTVLGNPATPADEADVAATMSITDVREKATMGDYAGQVQASVMMRITDRFNAVAGGGGTDAATVVDIPFPVNAACGASADPLVGATCAVTTSFEAVVPGAVKEGKRAVWQMGQVQVYDGGADGNPATGPNTLFARQGVFVP